MPTLRFGAALSHALGREALRQVAAHKRDLELVIASSTAASVVARGSKQPLDAIIIEMTIPDAEKVVGQIASGPDRARLLVVSTTPRDIVSRFGLRSAQVIRPESNVDDLATVLVERMMDLVVSNAPATAAAPTTQQAKPGGFKRREIVVLGCSTGGPEALAVVLGALPARFPVPIVIVQHMPPDFTRLLADRLDKSTQLAVNEVTGPVKARPGEVWIAPGHRHIKLVGTAGQIELDDGPEENNCKPAVDVLFRSAADTYGRRAVGVVLTGMGDDGAKGGKQLAQSGAYMIAQDEATSVVWGMPGALKRAGATNIVLPLESIAAEMAQQFRTVPVGATA